MSLSRNVAALVAALSVLQAPAQTPSNDSCTTPISVFGGNNPLAPNDASGPTFTTVGATSSGPSGLPSCVLFNKDVWFAYVAPRSGVVDIRTCQPAGFAAGTLIDTALAVYLSGACGGASTPVACNDDGPICGVNSLKSRVQFNAYAGLSYLIRVGSPNSLAARTFYLTVVEPALSPTDHCAGAVPLTTGTTNHGIDGATGTSAIGCPSFAGATDEWFSYYSGFFFGEREATIAATGSGVDRIAVYGGSCNSLTPIECGGAWLDFPIVQNTTYYIRVGMAPTAEPLGFEYAMHFSVVAGPPNDGCAGAISVTDGVYPKGPEDAALFDNFGATEIPGYGSCGASIANNDVFYSYVATASGKISVSTTTPMFAVPGTLLDTVLFVYAGCDGAPLGCNDDAPGVGTVLSTVEFDAVQGQTYVIRVADYGPQSHEGTFWLTIQPRFRVVMSSPAGAGSFRLRTEFGASGHVVLNLLTLQQGAFPYGPFFGIEPTITEFSLQIQSGVEPFLAILDGNGFYQFDYAGLPPLAVYAVALEFDALGQIAGVTPPASHVLH